MNMHTWMNECIDKSYGSKFLTTVLIELPLVRDEPLPTVAIAMCICICHD